MLLEILISITLLVTESIGFKAPSGMVHIPDGYYIPLFKENEQIQQFPVDAFFLDIHQVTNQEFQDFVMANPKWGSNKIKPIFADQNYLHHLKSELADSQSGQPVTNVSWFAARAYCKSKNKRLPTVAEWEYVARASENKPEGKDEPGFNQLILEWYSKPATLDLPSVDSTTSNYWGVKGMHGVVWELVNDINTSLVTGESRGDSQLENALYCGAGAASSVDPSDYAAFMRYATRSSYEARYTLASMGFRCAKSITD